MIYSIFFELNRHLESKQIKIIPISRIIKVIKKHPSFLLPSWALLLAPLQHSAIAAASYPIAGAMPKIKILLHHPPWQRVNQIKYSTQNQYLSEGGGPQGEVAEEVVAAWVDPIPQVVEKRRQQPPNRSGQIRHGSLRGSAGSSSLQGCRDGTEEEDSGVRREVRAFALRADCAVADLGFY